MTAPLKIWLIQGIVAPYRVKLFETIARTPGIDFRLILLARGSRTKPQWQITAESLPFAAEQIPGFDIYTGYTQRYTFNPRLFFRMMAARPDVVICAGYSFATVQAFLYKLMSGREYVIWMEGTETTENVRALAFLRRWQRKLLTRCAGALVDAGRESHRYLLSLLGKRPHPPFFTSYNAVDNEYIAETARRFRADSAAFEAFKARYAPQNILFVGQLIERKGIAQLLDAYRIVCARSPAPVGLIMLGYGPLDRFLRDAKAAEGFDHLYLEGFIEQDVYPKYLAIADVIVLPSLWDPNPLVVFEALAAAKPIVLSERAGNAADFVDEGRSGYVVDPMNVADVAEKLLSVLNRSPGEREAMGARSRELIGKANYDDAAKGFVDAARSAAGRRAGAT